MLGDAARVEADTLADAETAVERQRRALADTNARCLSLGLDRETTRRAVVEVQATYNAAVQHRAMLQAVQHQTAQREEQVAQVEDLARLTQDGWRTQTARCRQVLAVLNVRVSPLEHPAEEPVRLRVEGSVAHDVLLRGVDPTWHPAC